MPRRRKSPGKEQILVRGVVIATKVTAAKPAKQQTPRATKAKTTKPSAAIPALPAARILRLTQLLAFVDYCAVGAMRTVLPYYLRSLGGAGKHVGGLETAYGVGQIVGAIACGRLSDSRGRKLVLLLSFAGAAVGYAVAGAGVAYGSLLLLLASRLPVGLAKQTVTASRAVASDLTPPDASRSAALARLFAGCSLGYAVGPYFGGRLVDHVGHTSPVPALLCAVVFVLLIPVTAALLPETATLSSSAAARVPKATAAPSPESTKRRRRELLLLVGCTLPEASLIIFSSTTLALLAHQLGWPASRLGLYNSAWGLMSGGASLFLWPWLLRSGLVSDLAALLVGAASLGIASAALAASPTAVVLWACLILGTVAVGLLRTLPASLATKAAAPSRRGEVLGRLDAAGSACRVIAPAITGLLIDAAGLQAAFAAQAALCFVGIAILRVWAAAPG